LGRRYTSSPSWRNIVCYAREGTCEVYDLAEMNFYAAFIHVEYHAELGMGSRSSRRWIFDAGDRTQRKHQSCSIRPDDWDPRLTERTIIARVRRFNARPGVVGGTLPHSESPSECPYRQTTHLMSAHIFPLAEQNVSSKERCGFMAQGKPEMVM
jgi:hypothetical protein